MAESTDDDRRQLREAFVEAGRTALLSSDPNDVTDEDLADAVGVEVETFYRCYDGRGELFLEVYSREVESFTEQLRSELDEVEEPREELRIFFERYLEFFEENPYMEAAVSLDDPRDLALESPDRARAFERTLLEQQLPLIERIGSRSDGPIADLDPAVVFGFLRPLRSLQSDAQTSDRAYFRTVLDALVDTLVRGLTAPSTA